MAVEDGVDGADGGAMDIGIEPSQPLADLGRSPSGLVLLQSNDQRFDLKGKLVGVAIRPARSICQGLEAAIVVALEDLVARGPAAPSSRRPRGEQRKMGRSIGETGKRALDTRAKVLIGDLFERATSSAERKSTQSSGRWVN